MYSWHRLFPLTFICIISRPAGGLSSGKGSSNFFFFVQLFKFTSRLDLQSYSYIILANNLVTMRCAQLIYRCASRTTLQQVHRGSIMALQQRTYIISKNTINVSRTGFVSTTQLLAPRPRWIETRRLISEATTNDNNTVSTHNKYHIIKIV